MSVKVTSWVFEHSRTRGNDRLVLLAIADRADDEGREAYPSIKTLARKANCHPRTVKDCLANLQLSGELEVRRAAGRGGANLYRVLLDVLPFELRAPRKRPRGKRQAPPPWGWSRHHRGGGDVTTGGVVTSPPGGVVTSPPDSSSTSGTSGTKEQPRRLKSDGASRRVVSPVLLAAAKGPKYQRSILRRVAWDVLREQEANPLVLLADTQTRFLETLAGRLEQLDIFASPEQITRAGVAMWKADLKQRHPDIYRESRTAHA